MRESKSPGPASSVPRGKKAPRAVFRAREIPRGREVDVAGVVGGGYCCLRLAGRLTEACGPGMPGPYGEFKDIWAAVGYRNPSGAAAPPPFDKGGREWRGKHPPLRWKNSRKR